MKNTSPYVVCFGEILWDIFPDYQRAGGAPFNVAYHLSKMGYDVKMLSRIGYDDLGDRLISRLSDWNITSEYIQIDPHQPTSTVMATFDENNEASYEIVSNIAWDFIEELPSHKDLLAHAEAFVFGSLCARSETTRKTLLQLLEYPKLKVFDVNFRPPFIDTQLICDLLAKANIVKLNKAELKQILEFLNHIYTDEEEGVQFLQHTFNIPELILTKGSKGAKYFVGNREYAYGAVPIKIGDTVGSGDSFLAGFLSKRLAGNSPEEIMKQAVSLGAFITSKNGACPEYTQKEFLNFRKQHHI